eukprot:gnl/MRDRNA2_/MRDRNA2_153730_c0_seq1.p1 gnl/MRDRNA2_/MRDRNA2_153730_c0~~gnl/MRDRNA2_/MRDRNA2_153730_c0_seq1.p1  ORF type:complete len:294 (-),score=39.79 gnl/MRDRNA2_/MRDRNA2_153730_c0_seq1:27-908(-)
MGAGATSGGSRERTMYYCHQCQESVDRLTADGCCPMCDGGFIEESTASGSGPSSLPFAQAVRLLATDEAAQSNTEARITRLLEDLHLHLAMVEGLHDSMRRSMSASVEEAQKQTMFDPAPPDVLAAISSVEIDGTQLKSMKQTATCAICCCDFECGEVLSRLPGCAHLFHDACIGQWLERAANCPVCRGDLRAAVASIRDEEGTDSMSADSKDEPEAAADSGTRNQNSHIPTNMSSASSSQSSAPVQRTTQRSSRDETQRSSQRSSVTSAMTRRSRTSGGDSRVSSSARTSNV